MNKIKGIAYNTTTIVFCGQKC